MKLKPLIVTCLSVAASTVLQTSVEAATRTATSSDVNVAFALAEIYPTPNVVSRPTRLVDDADAVKARGKLVVQTDAESLDERTNRLKVVHSYSVAAASRKISNADIIKAVLQVNGQANTSVAGWSLSATPVFSRVRDNLAADKLPTETDPRTLAKNQAVLRYDLHIRKGKLVFDFGYVAVGPILSFTGVSVDVTDRDTNEVLLDTITSSGIYHNGVSFTQSKNLKTKLAEIDAKIAASTASKAEIDGSSFFTRFGFSGLFQGAAVMSSYLPDDQNPGDFDHLPLATGGSIAAFPKPLSGSAASNARFTGTIAFGASKMVVTVND